MIAAIGGLVAGRTVAAADEKPVRPAVGDTAKFFELTTLGDEKVKLSELTKEGPVVLIVLRGYPGYQCPVCTAQVGRFVQRSKDFADAKASVVLVYPGPADGLKEHAEEFVRGKTLPRTFYLALDPDYSLVNSYQLRWDAPHETAYPSTFVIGRDSKIRFARISTKHGGRSSPDEVLKALAAK
jgi:peroxiredoxin